MFDGGRISDVQRNLKVGAGRRNKIIDHPLGSTVIRIGHGHACAFGSQPNRTRTTDAVSATGNHCRRTGKTTKLSVSHPPILPS